MENNENIPIEKEEEEVTSANPDQNQSATEEISDESENEDKEGEDELVFEEEEQYDDPGELSELVNEVEVEGSGNASIVGATINIGTSEDDDTVYPCPNCQAEIDASKYGKIVCSNCGFKIFRRNVKLEITQFETIEDKNVASNYLNIIGRINNNFIKRRFKDAFKYCLEAEEIAPREPITWEYFSLVEFYYEMGQPKDRRKEITEILKMVRDNVKICEANNVDSEKIEQIKGEIGIYLFNLAKSKIGSFYSKSKRQKGYWSRKGRHLTINYLKLFEDCYRLTKDTFYLKGYVEELSKPYKWIVKSLSGELINLPACGKRFNAVAYRERVIKRIEKIEPAYEAPEVETERLSISIQRKKNQMTILA